MHPFVRAQWLQYGVALIAVAVAAILRLILPEYLGGEMVFVAFFPAVVLAAILTGFGPGMLATVLACLAALFYEFPQVGMTLPDAREAVGTLIFFGTGGLVSLVAQFYREEREKALVREKAETFRAFFDHAAVGAGQVDMEGRFIQVNNSLCLITGYGRDELLGMSPHDLTHPEDRESDWERYLCLRRGEIDSYEAEKRYVRKDGSPIWVQVTAGLIRDADGRPLGTARIMQDITERKAGEEWLRQSAAQFRQLVDGMPQLGWTSQASGAIDYINERYREFEGFSMREDGTWEWRDVMHPDDWEEAVRRWKEAVATGKHYEVEHRLRRKDGQWRWYLSRALPLRDESGRIVKWFGTATDIEGNKQLEQELQKARQEAEAAQSAAEDANRYKSLFVANISHELRTPMNAILGMTDLALHEELSADLRDQLETVQQSARSLLGLLDDLLDFSRMEADSLQLEIAPINLRDLIEATTKTLQIRAEEKGLRLTRAVAENAPATVLGDALRLRQVLTNLIGNAIKFTDRGEVKVTVESAAQDGEEVDLLFKVSDTGRGIPAEQQGRIFAPFVQGEAFTTRLYGGTGLGLAISRRLATMMNGELRLESEVGRGSTFSFTLRTRVAKEEPSPTWGPGFELPPNPARELVVLLAEDNPANRKLAKYILEDRGHEVHVAEDGHQALELAARNHYDVILMDVQMPGVDGLEATRILRDRNGGRADVPIIAMTAYAMKGDRERCLAAGMNAYLAKPIDGHEMIHLVEMLAAGQTERAGV